MDVAAWLRDLGLERYEAAFRDNEIDREALPKLTSDDLKDLGVVLGGHRRKLLDSIAAHGRDLNGPIAFVDCEPSPSCLDQRILGDRRARTLDQHP